MPSSLPTSPPPLGSPIPALVPHAISVSLPTWQDNIGYEEGHPRVTSRMETGYPRFFIHRSIQKLSDICVSKFGTLGVEKCILLPSPRVARECRSFILRMANSNSISNAVDANAHAADVDSHRLNTCRIVELVVCPSTSSLVTPAPSDLDTTHTSSSTHTTTSTTHTSSTDNLAGLDCIQLQIVLFPHQLWPIAKQFWQHVGDGVSSRLAERALAFMGERPPPPLALRVEGEGGGGGGGGGEGERPAAAAVNGSAQSTATASTTTASTSNANAKSLYSRNRHYSRKPSTAPPPGTTGTTPTAPTPSPLPQTDEESLSIDHATYLEERYGRNLPLTSVKIAKSALRRRIAGELVPHEDGQPRPQEHAHAHAQVQQQQHDLQRGGKGKLVTEDDVYLYPTGMSAIWHAHAIAGALRERSGGRTGKSVCFGFPYTDTLKILQKWGPGCHFFGHGTSSDIDALSSLLSTIRSTSSEPPIQALYCEFPSNPLLRSPDLKRLRALADEYGFLIVVDETIGNFVNVEVATWADVVVSSLTKVFSGETNVMGGSLVLSPHSSYYADLKAIMADHYEDNYFAEDAIYMERNSRDFRRRVAKINDNAYALTEYLRSRSLVDDAAATPQAKAGRVIKEVYYPRYSSPENYAAMQRFPTTGKGGFGGLFSLFFTSDEASRAFYDNLHCAKGPSLGTVFTLASPYAILAHYYELEWAKGYGVESNLVRVSVGLEDYEYLEALFSAALDAAEAAEKETVR